MLRVTRICNRLPVDTTHTQSLMCEKHTNTQAQGLHLLNFTVSEVHLPHFTSCFLWQIRSVLGSNPLITCADNSLTTENEMRRERLQLKNGYKVIMRMWFSSCGLLCAWLCSLASAWDGGKVAGGGRGGERCCSGDEVERQEGKCWEAFTFPPSKISTLHSCHSLAWSMRGCVRTRGEGRGQDISLLWVSKETEGGREKCYFPRSNLSV